MRLLAPLLLLVVLASHVSAQSSSSVSVDPLNGSTFSTPVFTPQNTFTPITTFPRATGGNPTVLTGVGPSVAPTPYAFSYTVPTATVSGTDQAALYSSLAASGYVTATDGRQLNPSPDNLQVADSAVRAAGSALALGAAMLVGAAAVLAL